MRKKVEICVSVMAFVLETVNGMNGNIMPEATADQQTIVMQALDSQNEESETAERRATILKQFKDSENEVAERLRKLEDTNTTLASTLEQYKHACNALKPLLAKKNAEIEQFKQNEDKLLEMIAGSGLIEPEEVKGENANLAVSDSLKRLLDSAKENEETQRQEQQQMQTRITTLGTELKTLEETSSREKTQLTEELNTTKTELQKVKETLNSEKSMRETLENEKKRLIGEKDEKISELETQLANSRAREQELLTEMENSASRRDKMMATTAVTETPTDEDKDLKELLALIEEAKNA